MNSATCYKVVYYVVKRELDISKPAKGCEKIWQWASKIPEPGFCSADLASALVTSVSHSENLGLECFFQSNIELNEIMNLIANEFDIRNNIHFRKLSEYNKGYYNMKIGFFIRYFFNGNLVLDEFDKKELSAL